MKMLKTQSLFDFLSSEGYQYQIEQGKYPIRDTYAIASLFSPIENGLYFFKGKELPSEIKHSLILVNKIPEQTDASNTFIELHDDVQLVYYKFLNYAFPQESNGTIASTAIIHPNAKIGKNVEIGHYSIIEECEIGDSVKIGSHCKIHSNTRIGAQTTIEDYSDIGTRGIAWVWDEQTGKKVVQPQLGGVEIGENCILGSNTIIVRGSLNENTKVGNHTYFAPGCRIGHGTIIGNYTHLANNVITGGNTKIGNECFIGSGVSFRPKAKIHNNTIVGTGSVVIKNTNKEHSTIVGIPAKEIETKNNPSGIPKLKKNDIN